jgi:hypothetical protein
LATTKKLGLRSGKFRQQTNACTQTLEKADPSWFKIRPEAEVMLLRDGREKKLLEFIQIEFAYYNRDRFYETLFWPKSFSTT